MSLRGRFLGAFILIIVLAVSLSVGVGYYTTQGQFDVFVEELGRVEAHSLGRNLSRAYTESNDWDTMEAALSDVGYLYDEGGEHGGLGENESESEEGGSEFFHIDRIRVVIVNIAGVIIHDNFFELTAGEIAPDLKGQRTTIVDLRISQPVGYAYIDVNHEFLATESLGFLRALLYHSAVGGVLITVIALFLAAWLSKRITTPITALTQAMQAIVQRGDSSLLPVTSSDELGRMSESFNQMATALQAQRDLRKQLLDDVSHELNTPLSVIQLEAHGLRKGLQTPLRAAEQIIQEVKMLHNLVRDLNWLAEAESESNEIRLVVEPYPIHQLLTEEVDRWQSRAQMHQITLLLQSLPELPTLNLDRLRMSQALGNVIQNAFQHTEASGRVTVAASMEKDGILEISVKDDGAGIDPSDLPHIFNRFYRTAYSRNRRAAGMGLGLAIAYTIIDAHNGTMLVTSDGIGHGTTVRFALPLH